MSIITTKMEEYHNEQKAIQEIKKLFTNPHSHPRYFLDDTKQILIKYKILNL